MGPYQVSPKRHHNRQKEGDFVAQAKETINKIKRQQAEWEKIFVNHKSDKELISKIHKEHIKLNIRIKQSDILKGRGSE